jgi:hypothetical protein
MRRPLLAGLLAAAALAAVVAPGTASAQGTCVADGGMGSAYIDAYDAEPLAPEIDRAEVSFGGLCDLVVDTGVTRPLRGGDAAFVHVDTDGDAATGDPSLGGADVTVATIGDEDGASPPIRGTWDGEGFVFGDAPVGAPVGHGGFHTTPAALGIASGTRARFVVETLHVEGEDVARDVAPNTGSIAVQIAYSFRAPVVPTLMPRTPRTPVPRPARVREPRVAVAPAPPACVVPRTKGLTVTAARARLRAAGCRVAAVRRSHSPTVRRGRVVRSTVAVGRRTSARVALVVSRGRRPR